MWFFSKTIIKSNLIGQFDTHCGFSKNISSGVKVNLCYFVTFSIIISDIIPENFIEIPQAIQKI